MGESKGRVFGNASSGATSRAAQRSAEGNVFSESASAFKFPRTRSEEEQIAGMPRPSGLAACQRGAGPSPRSHRLLRLVTMILSTGMTLTGSLAAQTPNFGVWGFLVTPMSSEFAASLDATINQLNQQYGAGLSFSASPPTINGIALFEFSSNDHYAFAYVYGLTSYDQPNAIAMNVAELDYSSMSTINQVNVLQTLLHELAHAEWSDWFWSEFATAPSFFAALVACHGDGHENKFGPCDEAFAYSSEAAALCATLCGLTSEGAHPNGKKAKALRKAYKAAVEACVDQSTQCENKSSTCGGSLMPAGWPGCPGSTCNC